ncbi:nucleotidyltransferase family protein [Pseudomonas sp. gcc21]|uniref:nucleotidyltransferase family protein n=1 Tax=Pseudomonas sp. gcc21 TaxID=2726989 RepID=UPI001451EE62|nr:nucleotidyltransferase family protein [Pseudomonas sp. gcc21]QJD57693.1 nucleotidyltransferase family protein [Pseudomonas sp. gcc21]
MSNSRPGVCTLVLAAGQGSRFRQEQDADKLLAHCERAANSRLVLESTLVALQAAAEQLVIVVRQDNLELLAWLDRVAMHFSAEILTVRSEGLGHSLAQAVSQYPARRGWLVALGDMPYVRPDTAQRVTEAIRPETLVVPVHRGQRGHPRGIGSLHRDALRALKGDRGAQQLFTQRDVVELQVDDPGVLLDIDRPEDLLQCSGATTAPERSASSRGRTALKP